MSRIPVFPWVVFLVTIALAACGTATDPETEPPTESPTPPPSGSTAAIVGRILDETGDPVADMQITAISSDAAPLSKQELTTQATLVTTTDADGRFELDVDDPGSYTLSGQRDGIGFLTHVTLESASDGGVEQQTLDVAAAPLGAIQGTAKLEGEKNHEDILVYARGTSFMAVTRPNGEFVISNVPAGTYTIAALRNDFNLAETQDVTVKSGESTTLATDLELKAAPAPMITSVSTGLVFPGETFVIEGSGFGDSRNLSVLEYAGVPLPSLHIVSWSDEMIEVRYVRDGTYENLRNVIPSDLPLEHRVLTIRTPVGTDASPRPIQMYIDAVLDSPEYFAEPGESLDLVGRSYGLAGPIEGINVDISTNRGTLNTSREATDRHGRLSITLTPESVEPHVVSLAINGAEVASYDFQCCYADTDFYTYKALEGQEFTINGTLYAFNGTAVPDAELNLFVEIPTGEGEVATVDAGRVMTDHHGAFSAPLVGDPQFERGGTLRARYTGTPVDLAFIEMTDEVAYLDVVFEGSGSGTIIVEPTMQVCETDGTDCRVSLPVGQAFILRAQGDEGSLWKDSWVVDYDSDFGTYCDFDSGWCEGTAVEGTHGLVFEFVPTSTVAIEKPVYGTIEHWSDSHGTLYCGADGDDCSIEVTLGDDVYLYAYGKEGYSVADWGITCDEGGDYKDYCELFEIDGPITLSPVFAPPVTLNVFPPASGEILYETWEEGSMSCRAEDTSCSATYAIGTEVSLTYFSDYPDPGAHHLESWGVECDRFEEDEGWCTLVLDASRTIDPILTPIPNDEEP